MDKALIYLEPDSDLSLQAQIRQKLVEAVSSGIFPPDRRLPSSRKLAEQLGVARNTVVLVYEQLIEEGYLVSRARSGVYTNERILEGRAEDSGTRVSARKRRQSWDRRFRTSPTGPAPYLYPPNWHQHPWPFLDGKFDTSLFPVREWREANRLALGIREIYEWAGETGDADDPALVEQIRTRILPRRGIQARPEEILVTVGAQQALALVVELLVDTSVTVAVEEPGLPIMRQLVAQQGASMIHQRVDEQGMVVDDGLDTANIVCVTPSHQVPTSVTMPTERRLSLLEKAAEHDQIVIEDDFEFESNYQNHPHPALRSMDGDDRVIYVSCLSKILEPGLCLGFLVASPEVITEARKLRRLQVKHPPLNNQRAAAFFLSLGHYDAFMMHTHKVFGERWRALREALSLYLLHFVESTASEGGTSIWIQGPEELEPDVLIKEAARRGILIEPVAHYYATSIAPRNCFRMGISSIPFENIREGVQMLSELIHDLTSDRIEHLDTARGEQLSGPEIQSAFEGATVLWKDINGSPVYIHYVADGRAEGRRGYSYELRGKGRWWVDGDMWYRQWERWYFGEPLGFYVVLDGSTIKLFEEDRTLSDIGVFLPAGQQEPDHPDSQLD
jgi:GntR family transcriptional regulator/MocR family aminotransferase